MVGVPSSKGCATCRRRRVKCDEAKPQCKQCLRTRTTCEGYERYPVFVHQTGHGLRRRDRFEEVKLPDTTRLDRIGPEIWVSSLLDWFLTQSTSGSQNWLRPAAEIESPSAALAKSLLALSTIRFGRLTNNYDAVLQGQRFYSESLILVQRALYNDTLMWHDETLAAIRAMSLYELFESTSGDPTSWQTHLAGITRLIELRGPARHQSRISRAILIDVRYAVMLKDLMLRKASFFSRAEWKLDWQDPEQKLYDLGFELAALLEQMELGVYDVRRCNSLHRSLEELSREISDLVVMLNLLGCKLLLSWVAGSLGLLWATQASVVADTMLDILHRLAVTHEAQRYIFPLTCLTWHYRGDEEKSRTVAKWTASVIQEGKVAFAGNYEVQSTIPRIVLA